MSGMLDSIKKTGYLGDTVCKKCGASIPVNAVYCPYCNQVINQDAPGAMPGQSNIETIDVSKIKVGSDWMFAKNIGVQKDYFRVYKSLADFGSHLASIVYGAVKLDESVINEIAEERMIAELCDNDKASVNAMEYYDYLLDKRNDRIKQAGLFSQYVMTTAYEAFLVTLGGVAQHITHDTKETYQNMLCHVETVFLNIADAIQTISQPASSCLNDVYLTDARRSDYFMVAAEFAPFFKRENVRMMSDPEKVYDALTSDATIRGYLSCFSSINQYVLMPESLYKYGEIEAWNLMAVEVKKAGVYAHNVMTHAFERDFEQMYNNAISYILHDSKYSGFADFRVFDVSRVQPEYH